MIELRPHDYDNLIQRLEDSAPAFRMVRIEATAAIRRLEGAVAERDLRIAELLRQLSPTAG